MRARSSKRGDGAALAGLIGFPLVGGLSAALVEQNLVIGSAVYYALLAAAFGSPQAAPLRRALTAKPPRRVRETPRPVEPCEAD